MGGSKRCATPKTREGSCRSAFAWEGDASAGKECRVVSSGAEHARVRRYPLVPNVQSGRDRRTPTMSEATMRYGTSPRVARRSTHALREGITVGLIGAAIVM